MSVLFIELLGEIPELTNVKHLTAFEKVKLLSRQQYKTVLVQANENKRRGTTPNLKANTIKSLTDQASSYKSGKTVITTVQQRQCVAVHVTTKQLEKIIVLFVPKLVICQCI